MSTLALRDHARQILLAIAKDMRSRQTEAERYVKSQGLAEGTEGHSETSAETHGALRQLVGFDLVQLAAEYRSHGLDEHVELYLLQLEVEQVLGDEFPDAYDNHVGHWADEEAAAEHHPMVSAETCSLCHAIAKHHSGDPGTPLAA